MTSGLSNSTRVEVKVIHLRFSWKQTLHSCWRGERGVCFSSPHIWQNVSKRRIRTWISSVQSSMWQQMELSSLRGWEDVCVVAAVYNPPLRTQTRTNTRVGPKKNRISQTRAEKSLYLETYVTISDDFQVYVTLSEVFSVVWSFWVSQFVQSKQWKVKKLTSGWESSSITPAGCEIGSETDSRFVEQIDVTLRRVERVVLRLDFCFLHWSRAEQKYVCERKRTKEERR